MSFILNALKKSELEREATQAKPLANKLVSHPVPSVKNNNSTWLMVLAIVNICFLAFVLWYFFKKDSSEVEAESVVVSEIVKPALKKEVIQLDGVDEKIKQSIALQSSEGFRQESIAQQIKNKVVSRETPSAEVVRHKTVDQAQIEEALVIEDDIIQVESEKLMPEKSVQELPMEIEEPLLFEEDSVSVEIEEPLYAEQDTMDVLDTYAEEIQDSSDSSEITFPRDYVKPKPQEKVLKVSSNKPPFFAELSYEDRRSIPPFSINVFVYSIVEDERFIMVDMAKYVAGQEIKEGLLLKEIREESVVVEYEGKAFQVSR